MPVVRVGPGRVDGDSLLELLAGLVSVPVEMQCGVPDCRQATRALELDPQHAETLRALSRSDATLARKVLAGTAAAGVLQEDAMRSMLADATKDPALLPAVFRLADAAGSLQRVARHVANVAEMVLYAAEAPLAAAALS